MKKKNDDRFRFKTQKEYLEEMTRTVRTVESNDDRAYYDELVDEYLMFCEVNSRGNKQAV